MSLATQIAVGFAAAWLIVFISVVVVAIQAFVALRAVRARLRGIVPRDLRTQLLTAKADMQRTKTALVQIPPLTRRATVAVASIAHTIATYRRMWRAIRAVWGVSF